MNPIQISVLEGFSELERNIFVENVPTDSAFSVVAKLALEQLKSVEVGQRLFNRIGESIYSIKIILDTTFNDKMDMEDSGPVIYWSGASSTVLSLETGEEIESPRFITLAHELIHAYHYIQRKEGSLEDEDPLWTNEEEYKTIVGFPSKKRNKTTPKITENAFRQAFGLPLRFSHLSSKSGLDASALEKFDKARIALLRTLLVKKRKRSESIDFSNGRQTDGYGRQTISSQEAQERRKMSRLEEPLF